MAVVTMRQLLESGVHFGHQTRRWNPKMKRFILTERNGTYIIDLQKSLADIDRAYSFVKETVAHGGTILFVGTKKQAQEAIAEQATRVGMPFVNQRWLGGMLTNFGTVNKRLQRLKELEEVDFDDVASSGFTKKELLMQRRERDKLARTLGGVRDMAKVPSAVWIVDTKKEHLAVAEARKLNIPVVAILDTNCDPDEVDYPIPGNDDAIRAVTLLTRVIADAAADGLVARAGGGNASSADASAEPLAEWERELLQAHEAEQASATTAAVAAEVSEAADGAVSEAAEDEAATADEATETVEAQVEAAEPELTETVAEATGTDAAEVEAAAPVAFAGSVRTEGSAEAPDADHQIKGNEDSMKYHVPGSQWYDATVAEVWFETAEAAQAAGFEPAGGAAAQQPKA